MELAIVADIGGTHTRMALANVDNPSLEQIEIHKSSDAKDQLVHLLIELLRKHGAATIRSIVLAVAGPVDGRICHATNLDWELDADAVERELHSQGMRLKVWLINDLEAMAWGVGALSHEDMVVLQKGAPIKDGPIAVIASGTGLGEAIAIPINGGLKVLPTEGGHADFAPRTPKEDELLCFLRTLFPSHVSYERVLSGPGLRHLTMFLAERSEDEGTRSTAMSML
ncbi:MAG: glucokinase, partial [Deltaproteobacteria bacterium]|nr:glucokinase [Deltaproteobacteria bacterium]